MTNPTENIEPSQATEDRWRLRTFKAWAIIGAIVIIGVCLYISGIIWQAVAVVIVTVLLVFFLHGFVNRLE